MNHKMIVFFLLKERLFTLISIKVLANSVKHSPVFMKKGYINFKIISIYLFSDLYITLSNPEGLKAVHNIF